MNANAFAESLSFPLLFEVSWEVARKIGGIYTVLRSKAPVTVSEYGDRYCLIGPYSSSSAMEFEALSPRGVMKECIDTLIESGIGVHFGRWLVQGYPRVLLLDIDSVRHHTAEWSGELRSLNVTVSDHDSEATDALLFGFLVSHFVRDFVRRSGAPNVLVHAHEWLAGVALPLLRARKVAVGTVFTTHATLLGRYLCAGHSDFYRLMTQVNPWAEADRLAIRNRYDIERAAAHSADVFTTVSDITADEAMYLLGRSADVIVPNGLQVEVNAVLHEFQNLHAQYKKQIMQFVRGHFYGHFDFNDNDTLLFFTGGRYEFTNKGIDMYLQALYQLNERLRLDNSTVTVIAFVIAPAPTNGYNVDTLKKQSMNKQLEDTCSQILSRIGERMLDAVSKGHMPVMSELMGQEEIVMLKRRLFTMKMTQTLPPIVTHNMTNDADDPVLSTLRKLQLFNDDSDRVKVVFHPEFLSSNSLIGLEYNQFVRGCHLGVFPSYYEPWGYTPAECVVCGIPTITSNLTGFANFMERHAENCSENGVWVCDRRFKAPHESISQIADYMFEFCQLTRRERVELRYRTEKLSQLLDWTHLGRFYQDARNAALDALSRRRQQQLQLQLPSASAATAQQPRT